LRFPRNSDELDDAISADFDEIVICLPDLIENKLKKRLLTQVHYNFVRESKSYPLVKGSNDRNLDLVAFRVHKRSEDILHNLCDYCIHVVEELFSERLLNNDAFIFALACKVFKNVKQAVGPGVGIAQPLHQIDNQIILSLESVE
jgi:hypothetical protein